MTQDELKPSDVERWKVGDVLRAAGDIWRVGPRPKDRPELVLVERLFGKSDEIMDAICGHAYPASHPIWQRFERLMSPAERYANTRHETNEAQQ